MSAPGIGWATWLAIVVVLASAAVLSFDAIADLAALCGVRDELTWLLPLSIDGGVAIGTRVWLSGRAVVAERFARWMTLSLLAVTVAANALHSYLVSVDARPAWFVAVAVGAVPAAVVGAVCHLVALLIRRPVELPAAVVARSGADSNRVPSPAVAPGPHPVSPAVVEVDEQPVERPVEQPVDVEVSPAGDDRVTTRATRRTSTRATGRPTKRANTRSAPAAVDRATVDELVAAGAGRRRAARALGVTEYAADQLLAEARTAARETPVERSATAGEGADKALVGAVNGAVQS